MIYIHHDSPRWIFFTGEIKTNTWHIWYKLPYLGVFSSNQHLPSNKNLRTRAAAMQVWDTQAWVHLAWEIRDFQHTKGGNLFHQPWQEKGTDISNPPKNQCRLLHFYFVFLFSLLSTIYSSKGCQVFALGSPSGSCKFCKYFHKKLVHKLRLHILDTQMDVQKKSFDLLKTWKLFQQIAMLEAIGNVFADPGSRKHLVGKTFFGR